MTHNVARPDGVHVCAEMCSTCIFRPGNLMKLHPGRVREMVDKATADDSAIVCHATLGPGVDNLVCRGFYDRYADRSWPLRLARHVGAVIFDPPPVKE